MPGGVELELQQVLHANVSKDEFHKKGFPDSASDVPSFSILVISVKQNKDYVKELYVMQATVACTISLQDDVKKNSSFALLFVLGYKLDVLES